MTGSVGRLSLRAKGVADRLEERRTPASARAHWTASPARDAGDAAEAVFQARLHRDRVRIIPWLSRTRDLRGRRILEVGCGPGASTVALAEQGAEVTGIDVSPTSVAAASKRCHERGLQARVEVSNAADLGERFEPHRFEWIIFWAALEHMTLDERLAALRGAWDLLAPDGLLTVIETPNRLWYFDSHTSQLPFFMWLPDELAFRVSAVSRRAGFGDRYDHLDDAELLHFQRRGRGVSYHEFHAAIAPLRELDVVSSMQVERRRRNPALRAGWRLSRAGRYQRILAAASPDVPAAFLQPFLYLTLRKS